MENVNTMSFEIGNAKLKKLQLLKNVSGTHSPSIETIRECLPDLKIEIDACFLSNPYATELFLDSISGDLQNQRRLRDLIEYYPSQNRILAELIAKSIGVDAARVLVGNGAIELIQYSMNSLTGRVIALATPTFSSYYEFIGGDKEIKFFNTNKEDDYAIDLSKLTAFIGESSCDSVVLINPNNPTGSYSGLADVCRFLEENKHLKAIILDESFVHFAYENHDTKALVNYYGMSEKFKNLIIIKSMSKDFGVAGIRVGYMVANPDMVCHAIRSGFLWNTNGLAELFIRKTTEQSFINKYEVARKRYIEETIQFGERLKAIPAFRVIPSRANFYLLESLRLSSQELLGRLLIEYGIYVRDCSDKIGLEGSYVRVASRSALENEAIINALNSIV
jgi:histidinol-phosphate/aromatic aminotransferase/cobyric acid decarboxylase-like protein